MILDCIFWIRWIVTVSSTHDSSYYLFLPFASPEPRTPGSCKQTFWLKLTSICPGTRALIPPVCYINFKRRFPPPPSCTCLLLNESAWNDSWLHANDYFKCVYLSGPSDYVKGKCVFITELYKNDTINRTSPMLKILPLPETRQLPAKNETMAKKNIRQFCNIFSNHTKFT